VREKRDDRRGRAVSEKERERALLGRLGVAGPGASERACEQMGCASC
jgi:hypothetical protein